MYRIGRAELNRLGRLIESGRIFRYGLGGECDRFAAAWGRRLGVKFVRLTNSGTSSLYAALVGLGVGPGDQVIVPSYTYRATALAVVGCGAIPVVADIDESLTLSPGDFERRITEHTKAVIPMHMVGLPFDMARIGKIAREHGILVLEDACQAVGGGCEGQMLGALGHAGAFSFSFYKNMTCGEGGAFVASDEDVFNRGSVAVDCCSCYWNPEEKRRELRFAGHNFRASEFEGAVFNVQLRRLDGMLARMRDQKKLSWKSAAPAASPLLATTVWTTSAVPIWDFSLTRRVRRGALPMPSRRREWVGFLPMDTGRHVYTRWDPIMRYEGAHHPVLNPFELEESKKARVTYSENMFRDSLDILSQAVLIGMHPDNSRAKARRIGRAIERAAENVLV